MMPGALGEHADWRLALQLPQERSDRSWGEGLLGLEPIWSALKELRVHLWQRRAQAAVREQKVRGCGPAIAAFPTSGDVAAVAEPSAELELRAASPRGSDQLFGQVFAAIVHGSRAGAL